MLKMTVIIMISMAASALTTIGILMRYANLTVRDILPKRVSLAQEDKLPQVQERIAEISGKDQNRQEDVRLSVHPIQPTRTEESVSIPPTDLKAAKPLYFDHQKLNEDIARISSVLERFNGMVQQEVQRYKGSTSETDK